MPGALLVGLLRPGSLGDALSQRLHLRRVPSSQPVLRCRWSMTCSSAGAPWLRSDGSGARSGPLLAARVRHGLSRTLGLLVGSLRWGQQMSLSMDARDFVAARHRSQALASTFSWRDVACLAAGLLLLLTPVGLSAWG